jgi:hypothetical protein
LTPGGWPYTEISAKVTHSLGERLWSPILACAYASFQKKLARRLLNEGKSVQGIAEIFHVHSATVYRLAPANLYAFSGLWANFALISV